MAKLNKKQSIVAGYDPEWKVDVGSDCELGIAIDDGCFLVLYPNETGQWLPGKHIPPEVAKKLGSLVDNLN